MSVLAHLAWTFFKISLFSIGGGYNMIPLMQHEVAVHDWLPPGRFMDILAVSEITPGPMAVNLATFTGYHVAGVAGSIVATVGVCLPGALLLLALGTLAIHLREKPAFRAAMRGLMPALVGLLTATALRLAQALTPAGTWLPDGPTMLIFAIALAVFLWKNLHPAVLMVSAAAAGVLVSFW